MFEVEEGGGERGLVVSALLCRRAKRFDREDTWRVALVKEEQVGVALGLEQLALTVHLDELREEDAVLAGLELVEAEQVSFGRGWVVTKLGKRKGLGFGCGKKSKVKWF